MIDVTRIERTQLDYATWHARIEGHNDTGASSANSQTTNAPTA
jgi:hypothetical protein